MFCFRVLFFSIVFGKSIAEIDENELRKNLKINPCSPVKFAFSNNFSTQPIEVNRHCGLNLKIYELTGAGSSVINGYYEPYGTKTGISKYEKALNNGTIYRLQREKGLGWVIMRSDLKVMYAAKSEKKSPPKTGWIKVEGAHPPPTIIFHKLGKLKAKKLKINTNEMISYQQVDQYGNPVSAANQKDSDSLILSKMLHPAVGPALGKRLHDIYISAGPVPSISIDNLLDAEMLGKALVYEDIPLKDWVGPETGVGCCKNKYRLNFDEWRLNKWARGLQALIHNNVFISFLEQLTGITGLVPVRVSEDRFIQLGSSMIAVQRDGYLDIHNDFNVFDEKLYRRINVLFYLNREWKESWQGHLELWNANMTNCVQRISPTFNRMAIFTVTDDAFHGHPEPLNCPSDVNRYALQLVYYTVEKGPDLSNTPGPKRIYNGSHSAVFQPYCAGKPELKRFCKECKRDKSYGDRRCCECNYGR